MFKRQTLFILGAGASAEVGMPLGTELAATISKKMDIRFEFGHEFVGTGDRDLFGRIIGNRRNLARDFQHAGWLIRDGIRLSQSIDDFLDLHRTNEVVQTYGKAAIVKSILEAEANCKLFYSQVTGRESFDPNRFADTWYVKLMHMLGRGVQKENVRRIFENVSFIIFNYDRCLQFFLANALQKLYGIDAGEASSIISNLTIIHPYGSVADRVPFGATDQDYLSLAAAIKTYTEQIGDASMANQLRAEVARAACIVFLGFAYHSQNMLILKPEQGISIRFVYGTAYKMSKADVDVVTHQLADFFSPEADPKLRFTRIKLENELKSTDLFDYYAKSLSGG
jgi:hypothetical protein